MPPRPDTEGRGDRTAQMGATDARTAAAKGGQDATTRARERYAVGRVSDFADAEAKVFVVGELEVGIYRKGETFRAYRNWCPHAGGPVCEGLVLGRVEPVFGESGAIEGERFSSEAVHIVCPWHGVEFALDDGQCASDRRMRLQRYEVSVTPEGDVVVLV